MCAKRGKQRLCTHAHKLACWQNFYITGGYTPVQLGALGYICVPQRVNCCRWLSASGVPAFYTIFISGAVPPPLSLQVRRVSTHFLLGLLGA